MTIIEALQIEEGVSPRNLFHFTDIRGLKSILKSKRLKMDNYIGDKKTSVSLAVVRPSMANPKNVESLSGSSSGGIKFVIKASELSDTVRGAKLKKIAEYPLQYTKSLERSINSIINDNPKVLKLIKKELDKIYRLTKGFNPYYNKSRKTPEVDKILDGLTSKYQITSTILTKWISRYTALTNELQKREGEERITLKKGTDEKPSSIPLDRKYITIEIVDFKRSIQNAPRKTIEEFCDVVYDNKKYFKKDDEYIKAIKWREDNIKKLKGSMLQNIKERVYD